VLQIPASRTRTNAHLGCSLGNGFATERNFPLSIWNASNRAVSFSSVFQRTIIARKQAFCIFVECQQKMAWCKAEEVICFRALCFA